MLRVYLRALSWLILLQYLASTSSAQITFDFDDGVLGPNWIGDVASWVVVPYGEGMALQSSGLPQADTLTIATGSTAVNGSWSFTFSYHGGPLTNFNLLRVFLMADRSSLSDSTSGYYLQVGSNNRDLRLYEAKNSGRRTLIASSDPQLLPATEDTVRIALQRSDDLRWTVDLNNIRVIDVIEPEGLPISMSSYFGFWVKHSSKRHQNYLIDDVSIVSSAQPDTTRPTLVSALFNPELDQFELSFSEILNHDTIVPDAFALSGLGHPDSLRAEDLGSGTLVYLQDQRVTDGQTALTVTGLEDIAGNRLLESTSVIDVILDRKPPTVTEIRDLEDGVIRVEFDEHIVAGSACTSDNFNVQPGGLSPANVHCPNAELTNSLRLVFTHPFPAGTYQLDVADASDRLGNRAGPQSYPFSILPDGAAPQGRDIVINEIFYDPPDTELEFVELYNRSDSTFDLSDFLLADNRRLPVPVSLKRSILLPDGYAVLVRDSSAFAAVFPDRHFYSVPSWPALNNSGDEVILFFENQVVDSVAYEDSWGGEKVSLERVDPNGPSHVGFNWKASLSGAGATPGQRNSTYHSDSEPPFIRFVDQIDSMTFEIYFSEPVGPLSAGDFSIGGANPTLLVQQPNTNQVTARFTEFGSSALVVERAADLSGNANARQEHPISFLPHHGDLSITEIMFDPATDSFDGFANQPEYVELTNVSGLRLSTRSLFITDLPDENGKADTLSPLLNFGSIPPGGHAVIFADPNNLTEDEILSNSLLVTSFPAPYLDLEVPLLQVRKSSLGLLNSGDRIVIHNRFGTTIDSVDYSPDWHYPSLAVTKGTSLERVLSSSPSDGTNWTSSLDPLGGTPGFPNSIGIQVTTRDELGLHISPSPFSPNGDGHEDFAQVSFQLKSPSSVVDILVFDPVGRQVRSLARGLLSSGQGSIVWDGTDDRGNPLRSGPYVFLLESIDTRAGRTERYKSLGVLVAD